VRQRTDQSLVKPFRLASADTEAYMQQSRIEVTGQPTPEATPEEHDIRTLKDLKMVLVGGGGDGEVTW
jgi:hypothetical protein